MRPEERCEAQRSAGIGEFLRQRVNSRKTGREGDQNHALDPCPEEVENQPVVTGLVDFLDQAARKGKLGQDEVDLLPVERTDRPRGNPHSLEPASRRNTCASSAEKKTRMIVRGAALTRQKAW